MVRTTSYRTEPLAPKRIPIDIPIGGVLRLTFPEPPAINAMLDLAKQRTRKGRHGGWMKKSLPVVYDNARFEYGQMVDEAFDGLGLYPPVVPWERWAILREHYRLHQLRDPKELQASAKWPVDCLVRAGWVAGDSVKHLVSVVLPFQEIDRANRGLDLYIERRG